VYDFCVIGGGIVGLATTMELLLRRPGASVLLLEKEACLAHHQTGHNSGVIHAGVYYPPASLKADLCRRGAAATKIFAAEHGIPVEVCGKLLVATDALEASRMADLAGRARQNGIGVEALDAAELARREPAIAGVGALYVDSTAIVDYRAVARAMGEVISQRGGEITLGVEVTRIAESAGHVQVGAAQGGWTARRLVVCAGLQADRLARLSGVPVDFQIIPFRGEYYRLPSTMDDLVSHLIYPIPDPELPFLGVHLTRMIGGGVTVGPNAVLGFAREGYRRFAFSGTDVGEYARFPGMWHLARRNVGTGAREMRDSLVKRGYLARCRRYCPELQLADLLPAPAGIRAQAVLRDGTLVHDFLFAETERTLHVCNAPSPAATSAMPIAALIADRLLSGPPLSG
jgi:(S)-2-hydroxyglutarate dehydrogenase